MLAPMTEFQTCDLRDLFEHVEEVAGEALAALESDLHQAALSEDEAHALKVELTETCLRLQEIRDSLRARRWPRSRSN